MQYVPDVEAAMVNLKVLMDNLKSDPNSPFKTVTRIWQPWDQLSSLAQPALVMVEPKEKVTKRVGQQSKLTFDVQLIIYARGNNQDENNPPTSVLNKLIQGVKTALLPSGQDLGTNRQSLGGLVQDCFIEGEVKKDAGVLDEQMSALIPITIIFP